MEEIKMLADDDFLVSETDERGVITFANDDFCKIAEYSVDELIGKPHNIVRHPDMPKAAFKDLWDTIKAGKIWSGYVKNRTKSGKTYWVYATVYPHTTCDGKKGYLSCRRKVSMEEIEYYDKLYKELKAKEEKGR
jgi:aerotaxis receptor